MYKKNDLWLATLHVSQTIYSRVSGPFLDRKSWDNLHFWLSTRSYSCVYPKTEWITSDVRWLLLKSRGSFIMFPRSTAGSRSWFNTKASHPSQQSQFCRQNTRVSQLCISIHTFVFRSDWSTGTRTGVWPRECHQQLQRRRFSAWIQKNNTNFNKSRQKQEIILFLFYFTWNKTIILK